MIKLPLLRISSAVHENNTKVVAGGNSSNFRAYPNPAKDLLNVQVSTKSIVAVTDLSAKFYLHKVLMAKPASIFPALHLACIILKT